MRGETSTRTTSKSSCLGIAVRNNMTWMTKNLHRHGLGCVSNLSDWVRFESPKDYIDPLISTSATMRFTSVVHREMSQHHSGGLPGNMLHTLMFPSGWIVDEVILWLFFPHCLHSCRFLDLLIMLYLSTTAISLDFRPIKIALVIQEYIVYWHMV